MEQWPKQRLGKKSNCDFTTRINEIESFFSSNYGCGALLFSSSRAALHSISLYYQLSRDDEVLIPRWSSHCLYNVFGLNASPTIHDHNPQLVLLNHKWGYKHCYGSKLSDVYIVEDSVDSVLLNSESLFVSGGAFEVISLTKLLGLSSGSIVFCSTDKQMEALQKIRDTEHNTPLAEQFWKYKEQYFVGGQSETWLFQLYNQLEPLITLPANNQIGYFTDLEQQYLIVLEKIHERYKEVLKYKSQLPIEGSIDKPSISKVPTIIPVNATENQVAELRSKGIDLNSRNFNFSLDMTDFSYRSTYFLPIHMGVSNKTFDSALSLLFK